MPKFLVIWETVNLVHPNKGEPAYTVCGGEAKTDGPDALSVAQRFRRLPGNRDAKIEVSPL